MRQHEHMKDMEQLEGKKFTRSRKKESVTEVHKPALMDHAGQCNHSIYWGGVQLPVKETDEKKKEIS